MDCLNVKKEPYAYARQRTENEEDFGLSVDLLAPCQSSSHHSLSSVDYGSQISKV